MCLVVERSKSGTALLSPEAVVGGAQKGLEVMANYHSEFDLSGLLLNVWGEASYVNIKSPTTGIIDHSSRHRQFSEILNTVVNLSSSELL